jgi:hypothetical protein
LGVGLTTLPCKKKIVEKPPRNSAGFCGGGQGLSWAVEPREEEEEEEPTALSHLTQYASYRQCNRTTSGPMYSNEWHIS